MAITTTTRKRQSVSGSTITTYHSLQFTGTYPFGGEAFDANAISGLSNIDDVKITSLGMAIPGLDFFYEPALKVIKVFGETTEAVVGAVSGGDATTAGGRAGIEVANATNLTGITALQVNITGTR